MIIQGKEYPTVNCYKCKKDFIADETTINPLSKEDAKDSGLPEGVYVCLGCCLDIFEKEEPEAYLSNLIPKGSLDLSGKFSKRFI